MAVLLVAPEIFIPLRRAGAEFHASTEGQAAAARVLEVLGTRPPPVEPTASATGPTSGAGTTAATLAVARPLGRPTSTGWPRRAHGPLPRRRRRGTAGPHRAVGRGQVDGAGGAAPLRGADVPAPWPSRAGGRTRRVPAAWRGHFSWLPQRPHLFNATLAENLRLGAPGRVRRGPARRAATPSGSPSCWPHLPAGLGTAAGTRRAHAERRRAPTRGPGPRPAPSGPRCCCSTSRPPRSTRLPWPAWRRRSSPGWPGAPSWWPPTSRCSSPTSTRGHVGGGSRPPAGGLAVSGPRDPLRRVLAEPGTPYGRLALAGAARAWRRPRRPSACWPGRATSSAAPRCDPACPRIVGILAAVEVLAFLRGPLRYAERLVGHDAALRALTRWRVWLYDCLAPRVPGRAGRMAQRRPAGPRHRRRRRLGGPVPAHAAAGGDRRAAPP